MSNKELFEEICAKVDKKCVVGPEDDGFVNPEDYQLGVDECMTIVKEVLLSEDGIPF